MSVDRAQLEALIKDLGTIPPDLRSEMGPGMRRAGAPVLAEMRRRASWSTRIPGATSMTASGTSAGVQFRVNSGKAPHARPYEHDGAAGTFRHPVYGNRENWVPQAARPFFYGAVADKADEVANALGDVVTEVAQRHGF
jgi:hypothetical protein